MKGRSADHMGRERVSVRLSAEEANRRYFQEAYRTGEHGWAANEPSPYAVRFLKKLRRRVTGGTLLDVGCGEGRHAIAAALPKSMSGGA